MPLKRWELACALAGIALGVSGWLARQSIEQRVSHHVLRTEACEIPVSREFGHTVVGTAIVFHGLNASRQLMLPTAHRLAAMGFNVYVVDLPGHGDSRERFSFAASEQCATAAAKALLEGNQTAHAEAVLLGHSMGGDVAIRVGAAIGVDNVIAVSPGPLYPVPYVPDTLRPYGPPERYPKNLLVLAGGLDLPGFSTGGQRIVREARGQTGADAENPAASAEPRSAFVEIPWATHTGVLMRPETWRAIRAHLAPSLRLDASAPPLALQYLTLALPLGIALAFPAVVTLACAVPRYHVGGWTVSPVQFPKVAALWLLIAVVAVALAKFPPSQWPDLYTGTYIGNVLLLAGSLLLMWLLFARALRRPAAWGYVLPRGVPLPDEFSESVERLGGRERATLLWVERCAPALTGTALGLLTILAFGYALLGWVDFWLSPERVWRFAYLAPILFNYFLAEEIVLGDTPRPRHASLLRCFVLRAILWLPMVAALWVLDSPHILIAVMAPGFALLSLAQRVAANLIRQRTDTVAAPAIFGAILAAWFIAALFPIQ